MGNCVSATSHGAANAATKLKAHKDVHFMIMDTKESPKLIEELAKARRAVADAVVQWAKVEDDVALLSCAQELLKFEDDVHSAVDKFVEEFKEYPDALKTILAAETETDEARKKSQKAKKSLDTAVKKLQAEKKKEGQPGVEEKLVTLAATVKTLEEQTETCDKALQAKDSQLLEVKNREMWNGLTIAAEAYAALDRALQSTFERQLEFCETKLDDQPRLAESKEPVKAGDLKSLQKKVKALDSKFQEIGRSRLGSAKTFDTWAKGESDSTYSDASVELVKHNNDLLPELTVFASQLNKGIIASLAAIMDKEKDYQKAVSHAVKAQKRYEKAKDDLKKAEGKPDFHLKQQQLQAFVMAGEEENASAMRNRMAKAQEMNEFKTPEIKACLVSLFAAQNELYKKYIPNDEWQLNVVKSAAGSAKPDQNSSDTYGMPLH